MSNHFPFLPSRTALLCALLLSLLILAGCGRGPAEPPQTEPVAPITDPALTETALPQTAAPQTETDAPLPFSTEEGTQLQTTAPTPVTNPPVTNPPVTNPPVTNPPVTNPPVTTAAPDGTVRVPKSDAVSDDYFADAAIIGDSRTVGLSLWSDLHSNYFCEVALNISTVQSKAFIADPDGGEKITLRQALEKSGPFSRVYISFGINEIGWVKEGFLSSYRSLISMIREVVFGVGFALALPWFFGLDGVLYSMPVSDLLTFLIAAAVIRKVYRELGADPAAAPALPAVSH